MAFKKLLTKKSSLSIYLNEDCSTTSDSTPDAYFPSEKTHKSDSKKIQRRKKKGLLGRLSLQEKLDFYSDTIIESSQHFKVSVEDVLDLFGGEDFFKKKFKSLDEAMTYIDENIDELLSTFDVKRKEIPFEAIKETLEELF